MKKTLIAAAVAASFAAPAMADTTLYGQVRMSVDTGDTTDMGVTDRTQRFGMKGSEDLGNGLSAIYKMEFNAGNDVNSNVQRRDLFVGLKGGFGTAIIGDHSTPEKLGMLAGRNFEDTIADRNNIMGVGQTTTESSYADDVVAYISPTVNGFHAAVAVVSANSATNNSAARSAVAVYENGPLTLTAGMTTFDDRSEGDSRSVSAKYTMGDLTVAGTYQKVKDDAATTAIEDTNYMVDVAYNMGGNNTLLAGYGKNNDKMSANLDKVETTLGVKHAFSKRTHALVLWHDQDFKGGSTTADASDFSLQLNHSF
jgi:predicted porin